KFDLTTDLQLEARVAELAALVDGEPEQFLASASGPESLLDLSDLAPGSELEDARQAVEAAALEALAAEDGELLQALLLTYDRAYVAAKDRESALDFEDLQLLARELLQNHDEIRERESWRFCSIMVDEFQDT